MEACGCNTETLSVRTSAFINIHGQGNVVDALVVFIRGIMLELNFHLIASECSRN